MKVIFLLIAIATVFVVVIGAEYLMKLAQKKTKQEADKQKEAVKEQLDVYDRLSNDLKEIKKQVNKIK